jgi:23S rRNA (cytosine1962-C5)-methyltransferase
MEVTGVIVLKKGKEHSIQRFHPWIFSGAIHARNGSPSEGQWVEVQDAKGKTIGFGHFQEGSIMVRVLSFGERFPGSDFYRTRLKQALHLRTCAGLPSNETNAFRLVHGEGDGLPGLIIDYYHDSAVIQSHSSGMHADRFLISDAIQDVFGGSCKAIFYRSQISGSGKQQMLQPSEYLHGETTMPAIITEYGSKFYVNWEEGQKTGFFLDQRENRQLLTAFSRGKSVLNTFCYTGGFSVTALKGGARFVHSVDVSEKAILMTKKNLTLNGYDDESNACSVVDTFEYLKGREGLYDVIILDPPAFAKHRDARHQAVRGYQRLNTEALRVIKGGGILFTFSCSQVVDRQLFYNTIVSSAIQSGRQIKVLHHLSQPADHPVSIFHPEGEYLKGLVLYVE